MATGRFAPSPSGPLHIGNLRTALVAWLFARSAGSTFILRVEDLDPERSTAEVEQGQLADLRALGLDWDGPVLHQSARFDRYHDAIATLETAGLVYRCYCTRREVAEAPRAPHGTLPEGAYTGTCSRLTTSQQAEREEACRVAGRRPSLRLRAGGARVRVEDALHGPYTGGVDDFVIRRGDGTPAYNLAVVVDDAEQGVEQVVRADDLLESTPRQAHLARLLGLAVPDYAHVPLVLGPDRKRLAKRHGEVTLGQLDERGVDTATLLGLMAVSLGLREQADPLRATDLLEGFDPARLSRAPWVVDPDRLAAGSDDA